MSTRVPTTIEVEPEACWILPGGIVGVPSPALYARTLAGMLLLGPPYAAALLLARIGAWSTLHTLQRWWARRLAALLRIRLDLEGIEHIDLETAYVVTPLHEGFADVLALLHLPLKLRFAARDELFDWRFAGPLLRLSRQIRVSPEQGPRGYRRLRRAGDGVFGIGESLVVFAQGTILGIETDFMSGAFALARAAQRPILPIALTGSHRVWEHPFGKRLRYGQRISLRVLEPIGVEQVAAQDTETLRSLVQQRVKAAALDGSMAAPRHFVPRRDGYWEAYTYRIDPRFGALADDVARQRARVGLFDPQRPGTRQNEELGFGGCGRKEHKG